MKKLHIVRLAITVIAIVAVLSLALSVSPVSAGPDRQAPTRPTNLRATPTSPYHISLTWNPSTDNSGTFSYRVKVIDWNTTYTVPQTQTSFTLFVVPNNTYSFYVYAVDGSGNVSSRSNTVSATTPRDVTAPTAPVLSLAGVNPTEVSLNWTASTDDGPYLFYQVFVNGVANVDTRANRFATVTGLTPETTYQITVKARDLYGAPNVSAPSNVLTVTTAAVSSVDTEAPTSPVNLHGWDIDGAGEINLFWTQAFDNQTPQASLLYEVYQNGVLDHTTMGGRTILYATQPGDNVFTLIAVDSAGNRSAPVSITITSQ